MKIPSFLSGALLLTLCSISPSHAGTSGEDATTRTLKKLFQSASIPKNSELAIRASWDCQLRSARRNEFKTFDRYGFFCFRLERSCCGNAPKLLNQGVPGSPELVRHPELLFNPPGMTDPSFATIRYLKNTNQLIYEVSQRGMDSGAGIVEPAVFGGETSGAYYARGYGICNLR